MGTLKLRNMDRSLFTSPIRELDTVKYNISVLAQSLATPLEFEDPQTALTFKNALGASAASFTVTVGGTAYQSVGGVVTVIVPEGTSVSFTAAAAGFTSITSSIMPEGVNMVVVLPWVAA